MSEFTVVPGLFHGFETVCLCSDCAFFVVFTLAHDQN